MIIDISLLETGKVKKLSFEETYNEKENPFDDADIKFLPEFKVGFTVDMAGNDFIVNGYYCGKLILTCDKCGEKFNHIFKENFLFVLMYEIPDDLKDDVDVILIEKTKKVDLKEKVRENILINLPVVNLCQDNCQGLCMICGTNLNKIKCKCGVEQMNPVFDEALKIFNK